jgi:RHS repeat-associated protein
MKMYEQRGHDSDKGDVFGYDEIYRLKHVKFNSPERTNPETPLFEKSKRINFDKLHNIMSIVETQNQTTNEIFTTIEGENAKLNQYTTFDQWGLDYDLNGNTTKKGIQKFYYDYRNQLVRVTEGGAPTAEYKYDALGRRFSKQLPNSSTHPLTSYYYSGNQVIEERDGSDNVLKQYIYGNGIDEVIRVDINESGNFTPYYFHSNGIGSVTAITDQNGQLVERISYDLYGMPTFTDYRTDPQNPEVVGSSVIGNELLFQSRRYEKETNLIYFRARYYDPIMGRFLSVDPLGYKDSMNLYQSFNQNPVNFVDPFGDKIYLTGMGMSVRDTLKALLQVFIDIGVNEEELKNAIQIDYDEKGYYITQESFIPKAKKWNVDRDKLLSGFLEKTTYLQYDTEKVFKRLEEIFTILIQRDEIIEFSIDTDAFFGRGKVNNKGWIESDIYGRGVCIDPEHILKKDSSNPSRGNKNIQIIVDPEPKNPNQLINGEFHIDLRGFKAGINLEQEKYWVAPLTLEAAIVHEFGHAYAFLMGYKPNTHEAMNAETAVFFENLYRLRAIKKIFKGKTPRSHQYVRYRH